MIPSRETVLQRARLFISYSEKLAARNREEGDHDTAAVVDAESSLVRDLVSLLRQQEDPPALVAFMTGATREERSAAFLRTYAERLRNGTAASWEIPNTVASTLEDIAALLQSARQQEEQVQQIVEKWRTKADARTSAQQSRDDPYDDYGHEMAVRASTLRDCADQLSTLLRSDGATTP